VDNPNGAVTQRSSQETAAIATLADLTADLADWLNGLVANSGVEVALRAGGADEESMAHNRTMLCAIHVGARQVADALR
jgi:hypothetical protein